MGDNKYTLINVFSIKRNSKISNTSNEVIGAMKSIGVVCILTLLIAAIGADNPCKDITFGGCENEYVKSKILSKKSLQTVQSCNAECYDTFNCTNYRYNNQTKECTLLTNQKGEYRDSCNIRAGPVDKTTFDCSEEIYGKTCGAHLEEDCEYNGELLRSFDDGQIVAADTCQELCEGDADCKYWIYHTKEFLCILKRDGRKTCNVWGGPKEPSYDYCKNLSML